MLIRSNALIAISAVVLAMTMSPAGALVVSATGSVKFTAAPYPGPDDSFAYVFNEQQGVEFVTTQTLDFGSIAAGTPVNSHYIQYDTLSALGAIGAGSIAFDAPIVGMITSTGALYKDLTPDAPGTSDTYFGLETTLGTYPAGANAANRGLGSAEDDLIITLGSNVLGIDSLEIATNHMVDGIRVLTLEHLPGDLDFDGDVDGVDVSMLFSAFNGPGGGTPANPYADLDSDGDVDGVDVAAIFSAFTGPMTPASVPEPGSLALLAIAGVLADRRRR